MFPVICCTSAPALVHASSYEGLGAIFGLPSCSLGYWWRPLLRRCASGSHRAASASFVVAVLFKFSSRSSLVGMLSAGGLLVFERGGVDGLGGRISRSDASSWCFLPRAFFALYAPFQVLKYHRITEKRRHYEILDVPIAGDEDGGQRLESRPGKSSLRRTAAESTTASRRTTFHRAMLGRQHVPRGRQLRLPRVRRRSLLHSEPDNCGRRWRVQSRGGAPSGWIFLTSPSASASDGVQHVLREMSLGERPCGPVGPMAASLLITMIAILVVAVTEPGRGRASVHPSGL